MMSLQSLPRQSTETNIYKKCSSKKNKKISKQQLNLKQSLDAYLLDVKKKLFLKVQDRGKYLCPTNTTDNNQQNIEQQIEQKGEKGDKQHNQNSNHNFGCVIDKKILFEFRNKISKTAKCSIGTMLIQNEDRVLKKIIAKQQLQFDYISHLAVLKPQNFKNFQAHERSAPYKNNISKNITQLRAMLQSKHGSACFSYNKFTPQQVIAILQKTGDQRYDNIKLTSLYLAWTRVPRIIQFLQFKKFEKLKILNIGGNFVQSIQLICQVQMPNLEDVYLWNNNITQLKALKKGCWPNLKVLDAHVNKIVDLKDLRFIGNKNIQTLIFDSNLMVDFSEAILMCSQSPKSKISIMSNKVLSFMGRPIIRRRKKAIQVEPCTIKVRYI